MLLEWFRGKFIFNHQLAARCKELEFTLQQVIGKNELLSHWNEELKTELRETKEFLYKRSGIIVDSLSSTNDIKPIQKIETWRTARAKLEEITRPPVDWVEKEKKEIAEGKLSERT